MANSQAMLGYGTLFSIESSTSPGDCPITYTALAEIKDVTPPNQQADEVDVTHNTSPLRRREFISGLIDMGEASLEMNFVPGSASDQRLIGLLNSGAVVNCRVTWPNNINWDFSAFLKGYEIKSATADAMTATCTFRATGPITAN